MVSGALVGPAHSLNRLDPSTTGENVQAWWAVEWAVLAIIANYVYDRFFAEGEVIDVEAVTVRR